MLFPAIHDILQPSLHLQRILWRHPCRQRQLNIHPSEVNILHRRNEERRPTAKSLQQPAILIRLHKLVHGVLSLHDIHLATQLLPRNFHDAPPRHALEYDTIFQWCRHHLQPPAPILLLPHHEQIASSGLRAEALLPKQPQDLMIPSLPRLALRDQARPVVRANFRIPEPARPRPNHVVPRSQQPHPLHRLLLWAVDIGHAGPNLPRGCRRRLVHLVQRREEDRDDVEERLSWPLDTERSSGTNHRRAQIHEALALVLGQPAAGLDADEGFDEFDELGGVEVGQSNAGGGAEEAFGVEFGTEEADFAVGAAVGFHALEAFGGVVEAGGEWGEGKVGVLFDLWGGPAVVGGPGDAEDVVGVGGLGPDFGGVG